MAHDRVNGSDLTVRKDRTVFCIAFNTENEVGELEPVGEFYWDEKTRCLRFNGNTDKAAEHFVEMACRMFTQWEQSRGQA